MIHTTFNNLKDSDTVREHLAEQMADLTKITDNKFPFHVTLTKEGEEHEATINVTFLGKPLASKGHSENLYKAIKAAVEAMRTQVIKKSQKLHNH